MAIQRICRIEKRTRYTHKGAEAVSGRGYDGKRERHAFYRHDIRALTPPFRKGATSTYKNDGGASRTPPPTAYPHAAPQAIRPSGRTIAVRPFSDATSREYSRYMHIIKMLIILRTYT
ncbi:hypothetical protein EVAR_5364_1 [Eumeta japonica]|uniref:Uncharacterized protein n=1 Tax=Eumeta variegata TaxID=151549 RepID=A0A4C1TMC7_EUMVA|nr:hypothetical protein EVAR_5364_1 [Eumeta japonica]